MHTLRYERNVLRRFCDKVNTIRFNLKNHTDLDIYNYDDVWNKILEKKRKTNKKTYLGAFVAWDNTPRRNKKGTIILGYSRKV